jgi:hypothetical protein
LYNIHYKIYIYSHYNNTNVIQNTKIKHISRQNGVVIL